MQATMNTAIFFESPDIFEIIFSKKAYSLEYEVFEGLEDIVFLSDSNGVRLIEHIVTISFDALTYKTKDITMTEMAQVYRFCNYYFAFLNRLVSKLECEEILLIEENLKKKNDYIFGFLAHKLTSQEAFEILQHIQSFVTKRLFEPYYEKFLKEEQKTKKKLQHTKQKTFYQSCVNESNFEEVKELVFNRIKDKQLYGLEQEDLLLVKMYYFFIGEKEEGITIQPDKMNSNTFDGYPYFPFKSRQLTTFHQEFTALITQEIGCPSTSQFVANVLLGFEKINSYAPLFQQCVMDFVKVNKFQTADKLLNLLDENVSDGVIFYNNKPFKRNIFIDVFVRFVLYAKDENGNIDLAKVLKKESSDIRNVLLVAASIVVSDTANKQLILSYSEFISKFDFTNPKLLAFFSGKQAMELALIEIIITKMMFEAFTMNEIDFLMNIVFQEDERKAETDFIGKILSDLNEESELKKRFLRTMHKNCVQNKHLFEQVTLSQLVQCIKVAYKKRSLSYTLSVLYDLKPKELKNLASYVGVSWKEEKPNFEVAEYEPLRAMLVKSYFK